MTIGIMLTYDQKPELFDLLSTSNLEKFQIIDQEIKDDIVSQVEVEIEKPPVTLHLAVVRPPSLGSTCEQIGSKHPGALVTFQKMDLSTPT